MEIEVDAKTPFIVGTNSISKINVSPINFLTYAECFRERLKELAKTNDDMMATKAFFRARRLRQVSAFNKANEVVILDNINFSNMPRSLFTKINNALDGQSAPRGEVLPGGGDGIYTPIIYKLGTPFAYEDTKLSEKPIGTEAKIIELEFVAKTGGDIEEVLCHENSLDQTVALIKTCATPLGGGAGILRLPTWMLNALTLSDGFTIMSKVLPVFLE